MDRAASASLRRRGDSRPKRGCGGVPRSLRGAPGGAGGPCLSRMHQAPSVDAGSGGRGPTMVLHSNRERVHDLRAWREDALVFLLSAPPQTTCTRSRTVLAPRGDSPFACKRSSVLIWPRTRRRPSVGARPSSNSHFARFSEREDPHLRSSDAACVERTPRGVSYQKGAPAEDPEPFRRPLPRSAKTKPVRVS